jgi:hypothetical protein
VATLQARWRWLCVAPDAGSLHRLPPLPGVDVEEAEMLWSRLPPAGSLGRRTAARCRARPVSSSDKELVKEMHHTRELLGED